MNARLPKYVLLFLVSALAVPACSDEGGGRASPTAPAGLTGTIITAEPPSVGAEFVRGSSCAGFAPFGVRLNFVARPARDVVFRSARFHFIDRFGGRTVPAVTPVQISPSALPTTAFPTPVPLPTSSPIPIPASMPIPIPGVSEFDSLLILGGSSQSFPFFLQFGCGVPADGTVFVDFDLSDGRGRPLGTQVRVRVRG